MKSFVAALSLVALAAPARADIFVSPTSSGSSTLLVASLLAAGAALVVYARKREV